MDSPASIDGPDAARKRRYKDVRIGIDGSEVFRPHGTGVATYSRNLSYSIRALGAGVDILYGIDGPAPKSNVLKEVVIYDRQLDTAAKKSRTIRPVWNLFSPKHRAFEVPLSGSVLARLFEDRMPYFDRALIASNLFWLARLHFKYFGSFLTLDMERPPKIMHWCYPLPVRVRNSINIYTVHDVIPLRLPYATLDNKRYYYRLIMSCCSSGQRICTVSERSRNDIIKICGVPESKISNTYQSASFSKAALAKTDIQVAHELAEIFGLEYKRYFLFFGAIEPKKNIGRLTEAFLTSRARDPLIIIGADAWMAEDELRLLKEYQTRTNAAKPRIRRFGYASASLLVSLIRGAKAVLFPSLYEGFGLPVLEAMTLGVPVLTSTEGAAPEIAGDAALLVDPYDISAITEKINLLDEDSDLRDELAMRGIVRAEYFAPERYQARLDEMYSGYLG
jgi:glycosyltransferase involved in cell wall biosynthesis